MKAVRRCVREVWRLFVDDGRTAALVVGWAVFGCLVLGRLPAGSVGFEWSGPLLFSGFAAVLAWSSR